MSQKGEEEYDPAAAIVRPEDPQLVNLDDEDDVGAAGDAGSGDNAAAPQGEPELVGHVGGGDGAVAEGDAAGVKVCFP
jgi:hypothetical protein